MTKTTTDLIRTWSEDRNLHTADPKGQALKLGEEFGELFAGLAKGNEDLTKDAIGDMYVVMTVLSQQLGFTVEECIDTAYNEIKDRKGRMVDGVFVKEEDLIEGKGFGSSGVREAPQTQCQYCCKQVEGSGDNVICKECGDVMIRAYQQ